MKVAFIEIKFIGNEITRKINIGFAILVEVADAYTSPIVEVDRIEGVDRIVLDDTIVEVDPRMRRRDAFKKSGLAVAGGKYDHAKAADQKEEQPVHMAKIREDGQAAHPLIGKLQKTNYIRHSVPGASFRLSSPRLSVPGEWQSIR
jgi:hypothetical protein